MHSAREHPENSLPVIPKYYSKLLSNNLMKLQLSQDLTPAAHELLRWPRREFHVTMPVKMDNGTTTIFHGFRVQHKFTVSLLSKIKLNNGHEFTGNP